ncbi:glycosyltransferase [Flavobacterium davisii]|uniref:glycosyltransferase n=1 Tax=Flavobacterium davisii TaxID=2906077 RepID=UPI0035CEA29C
MTNDKILGIIVTYNPLISELERNIENILDQVSKLYIFDNNSKNFSEIKDLNKGRFHIIASNENVGLGKAYNIILEIEKNHFESFVTFDQDTLIPNKAIKHLHELLFKFPQIGVIGPLFSRDTNSFNQAGIIEYKDALIQSCALFKMEIYKILGGFNEDYFIDSVDFEYCLRILEKKYLIAICNDIVIKHDLGELKSKFGIKFYSHSANRNYYIARNHVDISKRFFKKFPLFILKKNVFFLIHFLKLLFLESNRGKISSFLKGFFNR